MFLSKKKPLPLCLLQVPSSNDIERMKKMPAGGNEDQCERLTHITKKIKEFTANNPALTLLATEPLHLSEHWIRLFKAINSGQLNLSLSLLMSIPNEDIIFKAICAVHSLDYIKQIVTYCIHARDSGACQINSDIVITPGTFEILIKDIASTALSPSKIRFSFGLPSHHAFSNEGSGFCILNKTAILIKHTELSHNKPIKYVIIGTDINRDNGLSEILRLTTPTLDICHIDVFDSRVYPQQGCRFIDYEFNHYGKIINKIAHHWQQEDYQYYALNLMEIPRKHLAIHPAIHYIIDSLNACIQTAKSKNQKLMIFMPTGWDSHENETAFCGKYINGHMMTKTAAHEYRFNDDDLIYLYHQLLTTYTLYSNTIEGLYWGLEGGYDRSMYESQIDLLLTCITQSLYPKATPVNLNALK